MRRAKLVQIRFSEPELAAVKEAARQAGYGTPKGVNLARYIREVLLTSPSTPNPTPNPRAT